MTPTITIQGRSYWHGMKACLLWLVSGLCALPGQDQVDAVPLEEYAVKAALLYNVAKYTDWPAASFSKRRDPIVIGVLGDDPFGETLDRVVQGRIVNGHPIVIRRASGVSELKGAHLAFISPAQPQPAQDCAVLESLGILTVGDTAQTAAFAAVNFAVDGHKITFVVDLDRVSRADARISSKLLNFAKLVKRSEGSHFR